MATKEMIKQAFADHKADLGDKFNDLVREIVTVREEYQARRDKLPVVAAGTLDGNVTEIQLLEREEAMKWVLIKQKYGI